MRRVALIAIVAVAVVSCAPREEEPAPATTTAEGPAPATAAANGWVAVPDLPSGAEMRVVSGNPEQAGPFTVHLRFPDDYRVPPHTHPAAETVTVVSGVLHWGTGRTFTMDGVQELRAGQSVDVPANQPHFAHASGETVIEVRSTGPFGVEMVN